VKVVAPCLFNIQINKVEVLIEQQRYLFISKACVLHGLTVLTQ
jgi:hypothetical protein